MIATGNHSYFGFAARSTTARYRSRSIIASQNRTVILRSSARWRENPPDCPSAKSFRLLSVTE